MHVFFLNLLAQSVSSEAFITPQACISIAQKVNLIFHHNVRSISQNQRQKLKRYENQLQKENVFYTVHHLLDITFNYSTVRFSMKSEVKQTRISRHTLSSRPAVGLRNFFFTDIESVQIIQFYFQPHNTLFDEQSDMQLALFQGDEQIMAEHLLNLIDQATTVTYMQSVQDSPMHARWLVVQS